VITLVIWKGLKMRTLGFALPLLALFASAAVAQTQSRTSVWCENGHYYRVVVMPDAFSWSAARLFAESQGGYLASVNSAAENQFIFSLINDPTYWRTASNSNANFGPWIGGTQLAQSAEPGAGWTWTQEPWVFSGWGAGQPNNAGTTGLECSNENRVHYWANGASVRSATWNDLVDDPTRCGTNADFVTSFVIEFDRAPDGVGCAPGWISTATEIAPPFAQLGMMAHDPLRRRTVWFGGGDNCTDSGETWEWDGNAWTRVATTGPAARRAGKMVYDSARDVVLLFGGVGCFPTHYADLWAWDGTTWTLLSAGGPPTRRELSMAFDEARGVLVVFGGIGSSFPILRDTWEWDGTGWSQASSGGPSARVKAAMAFDRHRNKTILFGGQVNSAGTPNGDTWTWDGSSWILETSQGPSPRWGSELVFDDRRQQIVLLGGTNGSGVAFGEAWTLTSAGWSLIDTSRCLTPRYQFGAAFDPIESSFIVFGGTGAGGVPVARDTWRLGSFEQDGICDCIDFNRNSVFPEDQDVIDFFQVLAGAGCPYSPLPGNSCDIDFNNNAVFPEDEDVIAFLRVLSGGLCQ
jgi:hypothetical protein